jgi:hypothetical protein
LISNLFVIAHLTIFKDTLLTISTCTSEYGNLGEQWRARFEHPGDFQVELERIWGEVKELYRQLHAYTRHKLRSYYSSYPQFFPQSGHIPMHIMSELVDKIK